MHVCVHVNDWVPYRVRLRPQQRQQAVCYHSIEVVLGDEGVRKVGLHLAAPQVDEREFVVRTAREEDGEGEGHQPHDVQNELAQPAGGVEALDLSAGC